MIETLVSITGKNFTIDSMERKRSPVKPWLKTPVVTRNDLFLTNEFLEFYFHPSNLFRITQP